MNTIMSVCPEIARVEDLAKKQNTLRWNFLEFQPNGLA
jgi:hypothetical protein